MTRSKIEHVQNYPRPPVLEPVAQKIRVVLGGETAAETSRAFRVLETYHAPAYYVPPEDIEATLNPAHGRSVCEWKGVASYWSVSLNGRTARGAAWSYAHPRGTFTPIAGYVAFYAAAMDACFVGDERVIPQPGNFYGGWVTANLRGRIKGAPGTEGW